MGDWDTLRSFRDLRDNQRIQRGRGDSMVDSRGIREPLTVLNRSFGDGAMLELGEG